MNGTNRAVNRILVFVVGLVLLAIGAAVVLAAVWPPAAETWELTVGRVDEALASAADASAIGDTAISWLAVGALAAIVLVLVLTVVTLARLGGGRTASVFRRSSADDSLGRVVVKDTFAADALTHSLLARPDVVAAKVTAADVRKETVLHVAITARRSASPRVIAVEADRLAANLAALTGSDLPTYVFVRSGLRTRFAAEQRDLA